MNSDKRNRARFAAFAALAIWIVPIREPAAQEVEATEPNRGGEVDLRSVDPEAALEFLHTAEGYEINLFASEEDFPIANAVSLTFDARGRLWVLTMPSYPQRLPDEDPNDLLVILEDLDRDGRADKHTVFADKLHVPTGFELGDGGAYIAQQPNLIFARDTDGDDVADEREIILHGFGTEDSHHSISAFTWGPGGALYFQEGTFFHSQIETPYGPERLVDSGVFRYKPRLFKIEAFVSYRFANPWGHIFDRWGQNFIADASGGSNYFGSAITGHKIYPEKHSGMKVFTSVVRPTAGCEIVSSRHFPDSAQGNFLVNNTIGFQGIKQHRVIEEGSGFTSEELEPLLYSEDINFRPVDIQFGPDGALYIVDWFNPLVGHMQYSLRDPRRDHGHGRIWRITYKGKPLLDPPKIDGEPIVALLELLKSYEDRTRYRTRIELRNRDRGEVAGELKTWIGRLDDDDPQYHHHLLEALWVYETINVFEPELLARMLQSPEPRARAAATRVLRYWRDKVDDPLAMLERRVNDEHPRVRLEALLALSFIPEARSAEIALGALDHPTDYYLDYVLREAVQTLRFQWKPALAAGTLDLSPDSGAEKYLISRVPTAELKSFARSEAVFEGLLTRGGVERPLREEALAGLSELRRGEPVAELIEAIGELDRGRSSRVEATLADLGELLAGQEAAALSRSRGAIASLAREGRSAATRRGAYAALIVADRSGERAWEAAVRSRLSLVELLHAVPLVPDAALRDSLHAKIEPLLSGLPAELAGEERLPKARYIRIELPGRRRTLTVAELEVFQGGVNIARSAKARQSSTSHGGVASRAVDGNRDGTYSRGGQTHTRENERNPWLEIDLGSEQAFDKILVWNRTESNGAYAARLDGFKVTALDASRRAVFGQSNIPAPAQAATIDTAGAIQPAAIEAVASMDAHAAATFATLAGFVAEGVEVETSIRALNRLPSESYPSATLAPLAQSLVDHIENTPVEKLSSLSARTAFELGDKIASRLSAPDADRLRTDLANLGITVVEISAIPHQMVFDVTAFTVRAGRPVEIVFENPDIMPHNLVVTAPGAMAEVGMEAEATSTDPASEARGYVPELPSVLFATKLIYPGGAERLSFLAPAEPGDYPFVCTFPGHWLIMNGVMHVVEEVGAETMIVERRSRAEGSGAATRAFVKIWETEDLLPAIARAESGRDFDRGKLLFDALGCAKCHAIAGEGGSLGPDLTEIAEKYNAAELLEHVIEPSKEVEEKYTAYLIERGHELLAGIIIEQDEGSVSLAANPLDPEDLTVIARSEITSMRKSELSTMPTGLLTTAQDEEIYDLLGFLLSGADPSAEAFRN